MALLKSGEIITIGNVAGNYVSALETRPYYVRFNNTSEEFYLQEASPFTLPKKVYGDKSFLDLFLDDYNRKNSSVGVLFAGLKGSGKTLDMKMLAINSKKPIIIIDTPFSGGAFIQFLQNKHFNDTVIMFDEFEKMYPEESRDPDTPTQVQLLTLFDGSVSCKHLYLISSNSNRVLNLFTNRFGRIKFKKDYSSLSESIIKEVIADTLEDQQHSEALLKFFTVLGICTYDMLVTLIDDINYHKLSPLKLYEFYNVAPEVEIGYRGYLTYQNTVISTSVKTYTPLGELLLNPEVEMALEPVGNENWTASSFLEPFNQWDIVKQFITSMDSSRYGFQLPENPLIQVINGKFTIEIFRAGAESVYFVGSVDTGLRNVNLGTLI